MKIGILGAGQLAQAFTARAIAKGHDVVLSNSQGPRSLTGLVRTLGPRVTAGTRFAAAEMDTVVLAVQSHQVASALSELGDWVGRTLVDATNHFDAPSPVPGTLTTSEVVAEMANGAHVVKSLNNLPASQLAAEPEVGIGRRLIFVSGDNVPAKDAFRGLIEHLGFASLDLGGLAEGGRLQQVPGGCFAGVDLIRMSGQGKSSHNS